MTLYYKSFANSEHGLRSRSGKIVTLYYYNFLLVILPICHWLCKIVFLIDTILSKVTIFCILFSFSEVDSMLTELQNEQEVT